MLSLFILMMYIVSKEEIIIVPNVHGHFCYSMNSDVIMLFRKFIIDQNTYIDPPLSQNFPCRRAIFFFQEHCNCIKLFHFSYVGMYLYIMQGYMTET